MDKNSLQVKKQKQQRKDKVVSTIIDIKQICMLIHGIVFVLLNALGTVCTQFMKVNQQLSYM